MFVNRLLLLMKIAPETSRSRDLLSMAIIGQYVGRQNSAGSAGEKWAENK